MRIERRKKIVALQSDLYLLWFVGEEDVDESDLKTPDYSKSKCIYGKSSDEYIALIYMNFRTSAASCRERLRKRRWGSVTRAN